MERIRLVGKKNIVIIAALFVFAIITAMIPVRNLTPHHMSAFAYLIILILWGQMIQQRVIADTVRHRILMACVAMIFLFVLRMCKFSFFPDVIDVEEYMWYLYYVPMTSIPLFVFMAALRVANDKEKQWVSVFEKVLLAIEILLCAMVLTNRLHSFVFNITVHPEKEYTHEWGYVLIVVWIALLSIGTLVLLFTKCSLSAARKRWYIPMIFILLGCGLIAWYMINGGAPKIAGHKVFQIQEAYCLPFVMAMESLILIGMIPANTGYGRLFAKSDIGACIFENDGTLVFSSENWTGEAGSEDRHLKKKAIAGGYVTWIEDVSSINRMNRELEDIAEALGDENDLIRKENEVRAERVRFETKNRLYNRIASAVRKQATMTYDLLTAPEGEEADDQNLIYASVLSAYIKRMGNLMLLTESKDTIDSEELVLALNESMDYIRLKGCICDIVPGGNCEIPAEIAILAYELFETAVEDVWLRINTVSVVLDCRDGFKIELALDAPAEAITSTWQDKFLKPLGGSLSVRYEDATYYIGLEVTP
ncbi:MAG: hypothetical protein K6A74_02915 [Lachnospiraceae bacterium]|nr:hypothetical protein [Lachnospiraceae bacterium]